MGGGFARRAAAQRGGIAARAAGRLRPARCRKGGRLRSRRFRDRRSAARVRLPVSRRRLSAGGARSPSGRGDTAHSDPRRGGRGVRVRHGGERHHALRGMRRKGPRPLRSAARRRTAQDPSQARYRHGTARLSCAGRGRSARGRRGRAAAESGRRGCFHPLLRFRHARRGGIYRRAACAVSRRGGKAGSCDWPPFPTAPLRQLRRGALVAR